MQLKNNCTSNSRVIARGEAKCNFDCYEYNYSLIARKYIRLPINHIAQLYSYPQDRHEFQLKLTYQPCSASIVLHSRNTFIKFRKTIFICSKSTASKSSRLYTHFSLSASCCHIYPLPCISLNTSMALFHPLIIMS